MSIKILVVDDEPLQREILKTILSGEGYETETAESAEVALVMLKKLDPDVILTDLKMTGMGGLEFLQSLPEKSVPPAVIVITAHGTISSAVEAVRLGAADYLTKPVDKEKILFAVEKASERSKILKENLRLRTELFSRFKIDGIVGVSPRIRQIVDILRRVADSSSTIMIRGESGTGKELIARAVHYNSPRCGRPFTAINCAAIPENLFESELFGYEAGAFTGANGRREGLIEATQGGPLFLDEVGDMPLTMQSKLLRVLQDREIRRIGGKETIRVDIRILSATNKNLEEEVEKGNFREDLYYRLNVVFIEMPPLRERGEDIPDLVATFVRKYNQEFGRRVSDVSREALKALVEYRWPGNVRQLESVIERSVLLSDGGTLTLDDISGLLVGRKTINPLGIDLPEMGLDFEALEKDLLQKALQRTGGVASKAAKLLKMSYKTFLYRIEKFALKAEGTEKEE
jgi:DNA-binding NtrC family response regulator